MNTPLLHPVGHDASTSAQMLGPLPERRDVKKAVILAAGRGRRMGKLTADRPKGALEVGGHALIDWQIEALRAAGIKDIAVVTGHGASTLAGRDVTYVENPNWKTGTQVETLLQAGEWIGDDQIIISYSDIIFHPSAALALLERPGDIVVAYDADHRWLWRRRFGNWLNDSETFRLGPGQVLAEIGGKPNDIEQLDGQFMGLMMLSAQGLRLLRHRYYAEAVERRKRLDFTSVLALLISSGERIDTAANLLPWVEVDSARDLKVARSMAAGDQASGIEPDLIFAVTDIRSSRSAHLEGMRKFQGHAAPPLTQTEGASSNEPAAQIARCLATCSNVITNVFAVQNWGRSGSTLLQSLFDNHPNVISTPNFYSRVFYSAWASSICMVPDDEKVEAFLAALAQWWDTSLVDATAGLHRLGEDGRTIAGVDRATLDANLRALLGERRTITRRALFEAAHLAYARARNQRLATNGLQILYPIHGEPRGVAAAMFEDYPFAKVIHTLREPVSNIRSTIDHLHDNALDTRLDALSGSINLLFRRRSARGGKIYTLYTDRPYFSWITSTEQVLAARLEDIQTSRKIVMQRLAHWLGIADDASLCHSTWDGLDWQSRAGSKPSSNELILTRDDQLRVWLLAARSPLIRKAYPHILEEIASIGQLTRLRLRIMPWSLQKSMQISAFQCLLAAQAFGRAMPQNYLDWVLSESSKELQRTRLREMCSGSILIRKKLPDPEKHCTVAATLIVFRNNANWNVRALMSSPTEGNLGADEIKVAFVEEPADRSLANVFRWFVTIFIGRMIVKRSIYFRLNLFSARMTHRLNSEISEAMAMIVME